MKRFPENIKHLIEATDWTFAKTYAETWPHEYILRKNVNDHLFVEFVEHIRKHGYEDWFYKKPITYFEEDGLVYWTMGAPLAETIIINRAMKESTYSERLKNGTLPE
jgi:hypothetical protein